MPRIRRDRWGTCVVLATLGFALPRAAQPSVSAQEAAPSPRPLPATPCSPPVPFAPPAQGPCDRPLPINLPTALALANVRPIDIAIASQRIQVAAAQLERANVLWLPSIQFGTDYFRHDGQIQDVAGNVFGTSKSAFMLGAAPIAVFNVSDALFGPLAARQVLRSREASLQAARNDSLEAVAEAYFNVQQARGELAGAVDVARRAAEVVQLAEEERKKGRVPPVEVVRARTELDRRRQVV